jgi:hypothetical protein
MGGSKQPSSTTSVTTQELPEWIQPYAEQLLSKGVATSERPYEAYGGQRISPLSQEQEMGLQGTTNRALYGNQAVNTGEQMLTNTLGGGYLTPETNPYLQRNVNTAMSNVAGRLNSQFNRPGAYGNTAHQETMARSLGDVASQMYGQNYGMERGNQMNAANQALGYGQADYQDLNALLAAGDTRRNYSQDVLNEQYGNWQEQQNYPLRQLDILGNTIGMSMGNTGTTTATGPNPYQGSTAANLLGGASTAAGLYSLLR